MPYPERQPVHSKPKVFLLAFLMAGLAGHVNTAMLLAFGLPVSQMTGLASHISEGIGMENCALLGLSLSILIGFIFGAMISGLLIGHRQFRQSERYSWALFLEMVLLTTSALLAALGNATASLILAAVACGLQNALVASYHGLQIRTTHVTGLSTDIGVYIAKRLKGERWPWEAWLLVTLLIGFIVGGTGGVFGHQMGPGINMLMPALTAGLLALVGLVYQRRVIKSPIHRRPLP